MTLYIFDIDGTLADNTHRLHLIPPKGADNLCEQWDEYNLACGGDSPIEPVMGILNNLGYGDEFVLLTGRSEICREETVRWLATYSVYAMIEIEDRLFMRKQGDHRADHEIKLEWFNENLTMIEKYNGAAVFENSGSVVDMWRANGVFCFQVAEGYF